MDYVNPAFSEVSGYSAAEVIGQNQRLLHSGLTPPETYEDLWRTLHQGEVWRGEFINRRKDGAIYRELAIIAPIRDQSGRISKYMAIKDDVTESRLAEQKLRGSEARYRLIAENVSDVIWTMGLDGRFTYISPVVERMMGIPLAEAIDYSPAQFMTPASLAIAGPISKSLADGQAGLPVGRFFGELEVCRKDGSTFPGEVIANAIYDGEGNFSGVLGVVRDISERNKAEAARH